MASDPITVTTMATTAAPVKPATAEPSDELAPLVAIQPNGNGNGGHAVSRA